MVLSRLSPIFLLSAALPSCPLPSGPTGLSGVQKCQNLCLEGDLLVVWVRKWRPGEGRQVSLELKVRGGPTL